MLLNLFAGALGIGLVQGAAILPHTTASVIKNPVYTVTEGGNALCVSGLVEVNVEFESQQWAFDVPTDQLSLTDFVFKYTTLGAAGFPLNGTKHIQKTYDIWVKHCVPNPGGKPDANLTVLQVLTHGGVLDHTYWDFAHGYSYVDAAAAAGYATLIYDRLGIGLSDHPDPLLEVQGDAGTAVLHSLVEIARGNGFGTPYDKIVGIGHSLGSKITESVVSNHPEDLDAIMLTGYSYQNAKNGGKGDEPGYERAQDLARFRYLPNGYVMSRYPEGVHLVFFKYPNFDPAVVDLTIATLQTTTLGEMLITPGTAIAGDETVLNAYSGPVMVMVGDADFIVCGFSCKNAEHNPAEATLRDIFKTANHEKSRVVAVPETGHNLHTHLNAAEVYREMIDWVQQL